MPKFLAQIYNPAIKPNIGSGGGTDHDVLIISVFLANFIRMLFIVSAIWSFVMLLLGGFEYITAGGEKDKVGNATKRITNALIGIIILLCGYSIFRLINLIFGINLLNLEVPII
ncbi:MAG: hypothetical protein AAB906_03500 [Patescibacteria group bacterium]